MENGKILKTRVKNYNKIKGPRVGDYLYYKGEYVRFSYDWRNSLQTSTLEDGDRFYLGDGYISYSGSLNDGIDKKDIEMTTKSKEGWVWFFDNDFWGAGRGKNFKIPFRVFKIRKGIRVKPYDILGRDLCPKGN